MNLYGRLYVQLSQTLLYSQMVKLHTSNDYTDMKKKETITRLPLVLPSGGLKQIKQLFLNTNARTLEGTPDTITNRQVMNN